MRISDFIEQSNQATSPEPLKALIERAAGDLGFSRYAFCALTRHEQYEANDSPAPAVAHNYPAEWIDHYFHNRYETQDPVVLRAPSFDRPFLWETVNRGSEVSRSQRVVMHEARHAGLRDGVAVPLHGARGNVCLMSFAADERHRHAAAARPTLDVLATQFRTAYRAVACKKGSQEPPPRISPRERECLQWVSRGKSSWDISMILSIEQSTVNFHIRNAMVRLDAPNRVAAVTAAIRYGLITL